MPKSSPTARLKPAGAVASVIGGTTVRRAINRNTKLIRTRGKRWSDAAEATFLCALAASANITAAASAAGFSTTAIYRRRLRDAGFAARWADAIELGYTRLECLVLETATCTLEGTPLAADHPMLPTTMADALNLLKLHRAQARGGPPQRYGWRLSLPPIEEVDAEILRRVEAIERGRG